MDYYAIHDALKNEHLTWSSAAEAIGCTQANLKAIAARKSTSRPVATRLAILLRSSVQDIFPDVAHYAADPGPDRQAVIEAARARMQEAGVQPLNMKSA